MFFFIRNKVILQDSAEETQLTEPQYESNTGLVQWHYSSESDLKDPIPKSSVALTTCWCSQDKLAVMGNEFSLLPCHQ